jgi:uncharacterized membrane protein
MSAPAGRVWVMRRNCALAPRQLAFGCALPCLFGGTVAGALSVAGYPLVGVFAFVELAALALAFVLHARHAADRETLVLRDDRLEVEQRCGDDVKRTSFELAWLRVQRCDGDDPAAPLIALSSGGQRVEIGRHLVPQARAAVEHELRAALRQDPTPPSVRRSLR